MAAFVKDRIKIWEGLDNFRQILLDLLSHGVNNISQASLDRLYSGYNLVLLDSRKDLLINQLQEQIKNFDDASQEKEMLQAQLQELEELDDELIIQKQTNAFNYEYILKEKNNYKNLAGFVKIISIDNPQHRALVSWQQQSRDPVIFLAELVPQLDGTEKIYFHISLSKEDGMVVIYEEPQKFMWTQITAHEYSDMINAESGSISMDKETGEINLEDGNLASAMALTKAQTTNDEGINVFTNNVKLMQMYQEDLQKLSFNY